METFMELNETLTPSLLATSHDGQDATPVVSPAADEGNKPARAKKAPAKQDAQPEAEVPATLAKRFYVVQVYAAFEEQVKADIERQIAKRGLQDLFGAVLIPAAKVKKFFEVEEGESEQQLFPGYILVEMELAPQAMHLVMETPRVIKFLGGKQPSPLTKKEIDRIMSQVKGEVAIAAAVTIDFVVGTEVEITDGPFAGFVGLIDKVDDEGDKLTVMVSIFGRSTPVELRFDQVKR